MTTQNTSRPRNPPPQASKPATYRASIYRAEDLPPPKGRLARLATYVIIAIGPVVLLSILAAIIGYVRLLHGPVSLKAFNERIEQGINGELGDFKAQIDEAIITLAEDWRVELRLINLRIKEPDGDLVASAPLAAVDLNPGQLLWMHASPQRVFLIEPRVALLYSSKSGLAMSFSDAGPGKEPGAADVQHDDGSGAPERAPSPPQTTAVEKTTEGELPPSFHRINVTRAIADAAAHAQRNAGSHLKEIGVRNATVVVDYGGKRSELNVAEGAISLNGDAVGSLVSGTATVTSPRGPWVLSFHAEQPEANALKVTTAVRDLVPSTLGEASPHLALLEFLDLPVAAELVLDLTNEGEVQRGGLTVTATRGQIKLPSVSSAPLVVDSAHITADYDAGTRSFKIAPSTVAWGDSHVTLEGSADSTSEPGTAQIWRFNINALDGILAAEEFGVAGVKIDSFKVAGQAKPDDGSLQLSQLALKAGGAEVSAKGEFLVGSGIPSTHVEASMTPMSLPTLKALWPRAAAPAARMWIGKNVTRGTLKSASLKLLSGGFLSASGDDARNAPPQETSRLSMTAEASDVQMVPFAESLPFEVPRALIRLENNALEVTIPDASIVASANKQVPLKGVRFTVINDEHADPIGEIAFRSQTTLSALLEAVNRARPDLLGGGGLPIEGMDGKVDSQFKISMPLVDGPPPSPPKAEGKVRITDIRGKPKTGRLEVHGGTIDVDVSPTGVNANGEMLLNGVLAKLALQRIFDAPPDMQPPLRITATLDNADRTQLGLDVNHLIQGDVPLEISITRAADGQNVIHGRADLTNAELIFHELAWSKPPGRSAALDFDVSNAVPEGIELKNFRIVGDNIAIEGTLEIDTDNEVREFTFPNFSLNVVSRLEVQGKISSDRIWTITAKGSTYDAKDLFQSLLALGRPSDAEVKPLRPAKGVDLIASIDTVLGHSDVSMRGYKVKFSERNEQLVLLDAQGTLDGSKPLTVLLKSDADGRKIVAESADAGQAFKLIGFYPNLQGGRVRLEVNLDARGAAEKSGILWVDNFRVLGDPIISEVYSSAEASGPAIDETPQGQRRVEREVFEFDRMKVPFSVGHGQFVLDESYVKGQLLGASIRGKVDYNSQRINLGGTYVPLQGINSALCNIPLVGPIVSGLDCQGVFGITYAIQGPMSRPQVIVNPLSMFTPGILRGIMEMTNPNPEVQPRAEKPKAPVEQRVRASSSSISSGEDSGAKDRKTPSSITVDGWSSETAPAAKKDAAKKTDAKKKADAKKKPPVEPQQATTP